MVFLMGDINFSEVKESYDKDEEGREDVILRSRKIIQLSKKVIYALHRLELSKAERSLEDLEKESTSLIKKYSSTKHEYSGSYKVAMQEYIEALAYYKFVKKGILLKYKKGFNPEYYLLGICDLSGELVRKALNSGINGDFKEIKKIHKFASDVFSELAQFDFRNSDLRKKSDSMRWDIKKLEEMLFELKARGKI